MGVYTRPDSKWWWLYIETTKKRVRTAIPIGRTRLEQIESHRIAEELYAKRLLQTGMVAEGMMTEAQYQLIVASGHVGHAASALLAWLPNQEQGYECRCCGQREWHDLSMPCGELHATVEALGPAVRAATK